MDFSVVEYDMHLHGHDSFVTHSADPRMCLAVPINIEGSSNTWQAVVWLRKSESPAAAEQLGVAPAGACMHASKQASKQAVLIRAALSRELLLLKRICMYMTLNSCHALTDARVSVVAPINTRQSTLADRYVS
jgi:hypothetical protein